jgi:hypothetical protein
LPQPRIEINPSCPGHNSSLYPPRRNITVFHYETLPPGRNWNPIFPSTRQDCHSSDIDGRSYGLSLDIPEFATGLGFVGQTLYE